MILMLADREPLTLHVPGCPLLALSGHPVRRLDVRCQGQSGHGADLSVCPLMTQSGHSTSPAYFAPHRPGH
jgi:hypothetical protein